MLRFANTDTRFTARNIKIYTSRSFGLLVLIAVTCEVVWSENFGTNTFYYFKLLRLSINDRRSHASTSPWMLYSAIGIFHPFEIFYFTNKHTFTNDLHLWRISVTICWPTKIWVRAPRHYFIRRKWLPNDYLLSKILEKLKYNRGIRYTIDG